MLVENKLDLRLAVLVIKIMYPDKKKVLRPVNKLASCIPQY